MSAPRSIDTELRNMVSLFGDLDWGIVAEITLRSLKVSGLAAILASTIGIPVGVLLSLYNFTGREFLKSIFNTLLGIPTVVMGLFLYLLLAPKGPFGFLGLLYTEMGISLGQMLLVLPIVVSITATSIEQVSEEIYELALTLGASRAQAVVKVISEALPGIVLSSIAAFNRAVAELGIALMIGGNVFVYGGLANTRVLTTAIQMHVARGEIDVAIVLGLILLSVVFAISWITNLVKKWL